MLFCVLGQHRTQGEPHQMGRRVRVHLLDNGQVKL